MEKNISSRLAATCCCSNAFCARGQVFSCAACPAAIPSQPQPAVAAVRGGGTLLAGTPVLRHSTERRCFAAVVADGRQRGDHCLSIPIPVPKRDRVFALGAAARAKAAPAVDAVAVALKALVPLARGGQSEAHWAFQGIRCRLRQCRCPDRMPRRHFRRQPGQRNPHQVWHRGIGSQR